MNIVTSYLDCSIIYGNSKSICDSLRTKTGGQLNSTLYKNKEFMPTTKKSPIPCEHPTSDDQTCYIAGTLVEHLTFKLTFVVNHTRYNRESILYSDMNL